MPRNQHTITTFKGVDYTASVANIPPEHAIDALNVYCDAGGFLCQFQQPTVLWTPTGALDIAPALSLGALPTPNSYPRLLIQQGVALLASDYPYSSASKLLHNILAGIAARLDWALCNGILYAANGQDTGYVLPASGNFDGLTRYQWGISPPPAPTFITASTAWVPGSITVQRTAGVVTITFSNPHGAIPGDPCYIDSDSSATWDPSFLGVFEIDTVPTPDSLTFLQAGEPDAGPFTRATYPSGITATTGWQYGVCWGASKVAHFSSLSALGPNTGPVTAQSPTILCPPSPDWQVDEAAFFRNQDGVVVGGGQWLLLDVIQEIQTGLYAGYTVYCDTQSDEQLATSGVTAPYDNGIAPQGKYLAVWLDRILMCGISGDETGVRFTGYDSIGFGRPQMCWCTYNEIKLGQGQARPLGMGLLRYGGMVFFADDGLMYVYSGTLNDITVSAPTPLSFYAVQLPYNIGLYSHFSIQPSSAGLIWLDDGMNLRVMDNTGFYPPKPLAPNLTGLFKRMSPGSMDKLTSLQVTYLQRDWYILSFPIDGSLVNNMTVMVDTTQDPARNMGAFIVNHSITDMRWLNYPDSTKHLVSLQSQLTSPDPAPTSGYLTEIPLIGPVMQGLVDPAQVALNPPNPLFPASRSTRPR